MLRCCLTLIFVALVAGPAVAQTIKLSGEVTLANGVFGLLDTSVELVSGAIDLTAHVGQDLDLIGVRVPGSQAPRVIVDSAVPSLDLMRITGDNRIGRTFTLRLDDDAATLYYTFASLTEEFMPLDPIVPIVHGTLFLDPAMIFTVSNGPMQSRWLMDVTTPNDPLLAGVRLLFQSAVVYQPGELFYGNIATITFQL